MNNNSPSSSCLLYVILYTTIHIHRMTLHPCHPKHYHIIYLSLAKVALYFLSEPTCYIKAKWHPK